MLIVGEKINATIGKVKEIIEARDADGLCALAREQADAGADFIDVNVGTGSGSQADEIAAITWAVTTLQAAVQNPLCIDSADEAVLEAGLQSMDSRQRILNSTKAEEKALVTIVPLAVRYEATLVALPMDEQGIPPTVSDRLRVCETIARACREHGLPLSRVLFDPLVLPVSADPSQGRITLDTVAAIKGAFPDAGTIMGLSNVSYGLPRRTLLNAGFLQMAVYAGLDAIIANPHNVDIRQAVLVSEALLGKDRRFRRYSRAYRG